jgi:hypothetical protein
MNDSDAFGDGELEHPTEKHFTTSIQPEVAYKYKTASFSAYIIALGCLVVSVLAIVPKVRGFKPGRRRWIFKGDTNSQHEGEVSP